MICSKCGRDIEEREIKETRRSPICHACGTWQVRPGPRSGIAAPLIGLAVIAIGVIVGFVISCLN